MRLATIRLAVASSALLSLPAPVAGQIVPSPYRFIDTGQEVTVFAGRADPSPGQLGLGMASASVLGAVYAADFGSALTFELSSYLFSGDREVLDVRRSPEDRVLGSSDLTVATGEARMRLNLTGHRTWHRVRPFVLLGAGWAFTTSEDKVLEETAEVPAGDRFGFGTHFTAVAGGGIALHTGARFTIRLDATLHLWKVTTPPGLRDPTRDLGLDPVPDTEWVGTPSITIGTGFRF